MKIRSAHPRGITKQAACRAIPGLTGLAALAGALIAPQAAQAATAQGTGVPVTGTDHQVVRPGFRVMAAAERQQSDAALLTYKVPAGGSISEAAVKECHGQANDWTGIYAASRKLHLTAKDANVVSVGQELAISCQYLPGQLKYADPPQQHWHPQAVLAVSGGGGGGDKYDGKHGDCGDGDGDGMDAPCSAIFPQHQQQQQQQQAPAAVPQFHSAGGPSSISTAGFSGIEQCIISRESGGQTQVMNSSGHYGLFQFDLGTWESGGGSASDFGHASAGEQQAVFNAVFAVRGTQPWAPSDGC